MNDNQIKPNHKTYDFISSLSSAILSGLVLWFFATPMNSLIIPPLSTEQRLIQVGVFCLSLLVYLAVYFITMELDSRAGIGREINWLLIYLIANLSLCPAFILFHKPAAALFREHSLIILISLLVVSFPPMCFVWFVGFCHRSVKGYSDD